jgi:hypothetical protein
LKIGSRGEQNLAEVCVETNKRLLIVPRPLLRNGPRELMPLGYWQIDTPTEYVGISFWTDGSPLTAATSVGRLAETECALSIDPRQWMMIHCDESYNDEFCDSKFADNELNRLFEQLAVYPNLTKMIIKAYRPELVIRVLRVVARNLTKFPALSKFGVPPFSRCPSHIPKWDLTPFPFVRKITFTSKTPPILAADDPYEMLRIPDPTRRFAGGRAPNPIIVRYNMYAHVLGPYSYSFDLADRSSASAIGAVTVTFGAWRTVNSKGYPAVIDLQQFKRIVIGGIEPGAAPVNPRIIAPNLKEVWCRHAQAWRKYNACEVPRDGDGAYRVGSLLARC